MKICFAMIVFNGDCFIRQVLDSIYPYANQIIVNNGCVKYWQNQGFTGSTDGTAKILADYPDPDKKLIVINVNGAEKTELCQAYMPYVVPETTHLWTIDSDEVFTPAAIEKTMEVLEKRDPHSIGCRSRYPTLCIFPARKWPTAMALKCIITATLALSR